MNEAKTFAVIACVTTAVLMLATNCYDANKPAPCDPRCGELPNPTGYHRFKWERDKMRDAGIDVPEPFGQEQP